VAVEFRLSLPCTYKRLIRKRDEKEKKKNAARAEMKQNVRYLLRFLSPREQTQYKHIKEIAKSLLL